MTSSLAEPLQILVVDDDRQMLRTLRDILVLKGFDPCTASTGLRGLAIAESMDHPLAIAVVDLRLPDMDGIELVGKLHAISALTEVVILTGNASLESAVQALREQSFDYLTKPVKPERLFETLDKASERWRRKLAETALGESEARLNRMFQAIGDAVFITDEAGLIVDANEAALELTDFDVAELRTRNLADLLRPQGKTQRLLPFSSLEFGEFVLGTREGESLIIEMRTAAFAPDRYVHSARDITERMRLETQLRRSQRMEAVGQLAGGLAHDFNNVLTAITGYAQILSADLADNESASQDLGEIMHAADRAAGLTHQLLAFSRQQVLTPKVSNLNGIVRGLEKMLRHLIREDIEFDTMLDPELASVMADAGQIEQVIVNLVVNASDAMPSGGTLTIASSNTEVREDGHDVLPEYVRPGRYVALEVRDTGSGMDAETLAHMFEPFYTTKDVGKGSGLGLAMVYGIIKQSQGYIWAESEVGEGTRFTIYLPQVEAVPDEEVAVEPERTHLLTGSETVLVVEDDQTVRTFVRRSLERHGYRVLEAEGDDAVELAQAHDGPIDVVLTDVVMPGMGGAELAARLAHIHPQARLIFTSGYSREANEGTGFGGDAAFLPKPFTTEALLGRIREVLSR